MLWVLFLLYYLNIHVQSNLATSVTFADYRSSPFSIRQVCNSDGYLDVCCEPLDLDVKDGRGYGWFRADQVAFNHIESPSTITTVFGKNTRRPCSDDLLAQRQGQQKWQTDFLRGEGAGSAAAVTTFRPIYMRRKWPSVIFLHGIEFRLISLEPGETASYRDRRGDVIEGRKPRTSILPSKEKANSHG